jgi:hypothetical protein
VGKGLGGRLLRDGESGQPWFERTGFDELWLRGAGLVLFLADLLAVALSGKGFFDTLLFAGLQIEGVTLHFLNDVFGLYLAFEAAQCIFERFAFLHSNLCQGVYTSKSSQVGRVQNTA